MAARGRPQGSPLRRYALGRRPFSVGADAPGRPLLPLRGNSPSAHIGPTYARLMHLPCNPFLYLIFCQASGGPLDGSLLAAKPLRPTLQTCHWHVCFTLRFRFSPFPAPIFGISPKLFYR